MAENQIHTALNRLFEKYRVVFWYDDKKEFRKEFENVDLEGIEKVEIYQLIYQDTMFLMLKEVLLNHTQV